MSWNIKLKVNPQGPRLVGDALEKAFREKLGPKIVSNAKTIVPVDTGALRRAIDFDVTRAKDAEATLIIGVDGVDYGVWVERGTSKMAAQPFLEPAVYQARGMSL